MKTIIYAGPSLTKESRVKIEQEKMELKPPVYRGCIDSILNNGFSGTIIIVDGRFKELLAVGHAEIRNALQNGCMVFGLSSMGAIRAYEMQSLGMIGYGKVYEYFKKEEDFQDDEVALLHAEHPYFFAISEPLVHFRECISDLVMKRRLSHELGAQIINKLKDMYFGKRTMSLFLQLLGRCSGVDIQSVERDFHKYRIKNSDLENFLKEKVWMQLRS